MAKYVVDTNGIGKGYDYSYTSITALRSRLAKDHFPQSSAKFGSKVATIMEVGKKTQSQVGTLYFTDYFKGLYLLNAVGIWIPYKGGMKNARFVRSNGTLGSYADTYLKSWDIKSGRRV